MLFLLSIACYHAGKIDMRELDESFEPDPQPQDSAVVDTSPIDTGDSEPPMPICPNDMVFVDQEFCIDPFEAKLEEFSGGEWTEASPYYPVNGREVRAVSRVGRTPQAHISGVEAEIACQNAGKRLCSSDEWLRACQGPSTTTYPYGDVYQDGACNDEYEGHPVINYFGTSDGIWDSEHMNDPGINQQNNTVAQTGEFSACVSAEGIYDMHGNLHEWVSDADGTFRGGFYADAAINGSGCLYRTTAHSMEYYDYSTGFRCCKDPE